MTDFTNDKSIKETLNVIRKAIQEDDVDKTDDVLVLNQLVKKDGTIESINTINITKKEVKEILEEKLSEIFQQHFEKWLNKNIPNHLERYFSKKEK